MLFVDLLPFLFYFGEDFYRKTTRIPDKNKTQSMHTQIVQMFWTHQHQRRYGCQCVRESARFDNSWTCPTESRPTAKTDCLEQQNLVEMLPKVWIAGFNPFSLDQCGTWKGMLANNVYYYYFYLCDFDTERIRYYADSIWRLEKGALPAQLFAWTWLCKHCTRPVKWRHGVKPNSLGWMLKFVWHNFNPLPLAQCHP